MHGSVLKLVEQYNDFMIKGKRRIYIFKKKYMKYPVGIVNFKFSIAIFIVDDHKLSISSDVDM